MAALMLLPLVVASASSTVDLLGRDAAGRPLEVAATSSSGAQAGLLRTLDPEGAPLTQVDQSGKGWSFSRDLGTRELLGAQEIGGSGSRRRRRRRRRRRKPTTVPCGRPGRRRW